MSSEAPPETSPAQNVGMLSPDALAGDLRDLVLRLESLEAVWRVIAVLGIPPEAQHVVFGVDGLRTELMQLPADPEGRDPAKLPKLDMLLRALESETRGLAREIPVAKLRQILPSQFPEHRSDVLALLNVLLPDRDELDARSQGHLAALDYLITVLCTGGPDWNGRALQDPVSLTPRLCALCDEIAEEDTAYDIEAVAAEFRDSPGADPTVTVDHDELRAIRRRKRELGAYYFDPSVLRAIVAYNAARNLCIDQGGHDSREWGSHSNRATQVGASTSVFETEVLPALGDALTRRANQEPPTPSAVDRLAWCLGLEELGAFERTSVTRGDVGTLRNIEGTAVLVGLLHGVSVVVEDELPSIGIGPDQLGPDWLRELDAALKKAVHERIAADGYKDACELSEYRIRFTESLRGGEEPETRPVAPAVVLPKPNTVRWDRKEPEQTAKPLKRKNKGRAATLEPTMRPVAKPWTLTRIKGVIAVVGLVGAIGFATYTAFFSGDLARFSGSQLVEISPYLVKGARNERGSGSAFVGTIDTAWMQLTPDEQARASADLVEAVRGFGVRSVMIYDRDGNLRIQSLGPGEPRIVPSIKR